MPFQAYDPEAVALLSGVLKAAWEDLRRARSMPDDDGKRSALPKQALTDHLLSAYNAGVRDPAELKRRALAGL